MSSDDSPTRSADLEEFAFVMPAEEKQRLREIRGEIVSDDPSEHVSLSDLGREMARLYIAQFDSDPDRCRPLERGAVDPTEGGD